MIFNVAQLLKSPVGTTHDVDLDNDDKLDLKDDEVELAGPVSGSLRLHRTNQGIFATGMVTVPVHLTCTRCLKEFNDDFTFPLREEFYPTIDVVTGMPVPAPDDPELSFPINRHHEIDTREAIRQNLVLALPMSALCREDCAGLCPHCGKDLNEGPCDCKPEVVDDRFAVLRELLNGVKAAEAD
ncbi:MAG TPA: DUF177 domain-containing protein [Ktedonobacterales bacterium]|nr:DUF177 domain-containing protein [Ktedonobacterales bacterium]